MKVVILAGGFGTRLSEYTSSIPKPMVDVGGRPILWHIMQWYSSFGYNDFIIALGYKGQKIKEYFLNYQLLNSDLTLDFQSARRDWMSKCSVSEKWKVSLIDTGLETLTGGRLKRLEPLLTERFMLTYGDGVSNVNLDELLEFHEQNNAEVTMTAVRPSARFGELRFAEKSSRITTFAEKPQLNSGWVNGGFFVIEPMFIRRCVDDQTVLEGHPLESVATDGKLFAHKHYNFWQCMDTKRDRDYLNNLVAENKAPWLRGVAVGD